MIIEGYKDLKILHESLDYMLSLYQQTSSFPTLEAHELTTQIRTLVMGLCGDIATGYVGHGQNFGQSLASAEQSLSLITHDIETAHEKGYLTTTNRDTLIEGADTILRMITSLKCGKQKLMHDKKISSAEAA